MELKIKPGELVSFQKENYKIRQLTGNLKSVILESTSNSTVVTVDIKNLLPPISKSETDKITSDFKADALESFENEDWEIAQKRLAIIRPILISKGNGLLVKEIAEENNLGVATLYRWVDKFEKTGHVSSLIPDKSSGGKGKSRLTPEIDAIVKTVIDELYLTNQKNPIKKVGREIIRRCKLLELTPPNISTVRNRILAISEEKRLRFRESKKIADDKFKPNLKHFPNADYPLSVVQIDHTLLDIILVDETYRKPIGRPWITLAIDVYSRVITGLYISFDPPGALGTGMCIANSILPKETWLINLEIDGDWGVWGKMATIHVDNAKEFRGNMLYRACEEYGINLEWRPVKQPNWGGHIERLIGSIVKEIHTLPGATFSNPKQRGEYNSENKAAFTLKEFEKWLVTYIVNIYHKRLHSGIGMSPMHKFQEGVFQKSGIPPRIFNELKVKLDFLPYFERSIQEYGVVIDYIFYYADVLRKWIHTVENNKIKSRVKKKFIFKRDPRDISTLFFYDPELKEYFQIPYRDTSKPPITIWEHREVVNRLVKDGIKEIDENLIFNTYNKLKELEEQAVAQTNKIKRIKKIAKKKHTHDKSIQKEFQTDLSESNSFIDSKINLSNIQPFEEIEHETFD